MTNNIYSLDGNHAITQSVADSVCNMLKLCHSVCNMSIIVLFLVFE